MQQIPENKNQQYKLTIDASTESKYRPCTQEKENIANIPQYAIDALARSLLPIIQKYFKVRKISGNLKSGKLKKKSKIQARKKT